LAPPPPSTITRQSLPAASRIPDMKITIYSWSIKKITISFQPVTDRVVDHSVPCPPVLKLIATNLDGTLLRNNRTVSEWTLRALRTAVFVTARPAAPLVD
ncbi:HAD family hydrolase, partial [Streptomyces sp. NPDC057748]|uniref:HAD family hydrolase n=1 Tax=unclassified Streptomyces TaxID=2593676 RepID=UPI0036804D83